MGLNGKPMDLLGNVELFCDTMSERFGNGKSNMIIIASNGDNSLFTSFGTHDAHLDTISSALFNDDELFCLIQSALALAITAKLRQEENDDDDNE